MYGSLKQVHYIAFDCVENANYIYFCKPLLAVFAGSQKSFKFLSSSDVLWLTPTTLVNSIIYDLEFSMPLKAIFKIFELEDIIVVVTPKAPSAR